MFTEQIKAGAKLLDEKKPDWLERQNLESLNLSDPCSCVVAQSCPDMHYVDALVELFEVDDDEEVDLFEMSSNHGFATDCIGEYPQLTKGWKAYIQERRLQKVGGCVNSQYSLRYSQKKNRCTDNEEKQNRRIFSYIFSERSLKHMWIIATRTDNLSHIKFRRLLEQPQATCAKIFVRKSVCFEPLKCTCAGWEIFVRKKSNV
jgi:hypothetical protein